MQYIFSFTLFSVKNIKMLDKCFSYESYSVFFSIFLNLLKYFKIFETQTLYLSFV